MDQHQQDDNKFKHIMKMRNEGCDCNECKVMKAEMFVNSNYFNAMTEIVGHTCSECEEYRHWEFYEIYNSHVCDFCIRDVYFGDFKLIRSISLHCLSRNLEVTEWRCKIYTGLARGKERKKRKFQVQPVLLELDMWKEEFMECKTTFDISRFERKFKRELTEMIDNLDFKLPLPYHPDDDDDDGGFKQPPGINYMTDDDNDETDDDDEGEAPPVWAYLEVPDSDTDDE